ncbi:unnamed protein product [Spirodela intermedia]|uniref:Uncharacterized protein n=1 Tax=Spirodela intermedia TaxID=51605 RepID=A0A7I8KAU7_SPIIN|nr:unnamed protein product [Spirodela intermedia]
MRNPLLSDSCRDTQQLHSVNPQPWLQVERGKLSKSFPRSPSSVESFIKVPEPPILPLFKPVDYVEVLAQIHEELESCPPQEASSLYLLQFHVFRGLGERKLLRPSLRCAWHKATTAYEKLVFLAWLKYENHHHGDELTDFSAAEEMDVTAAAGDSHSSSATAASGGVVLFRIGGDLVAGDRRRMAALSAPFDAMLNGSFSESKLEIIDMSENGISTLGMRQVCKFSETGNLGDLPPQLLLEILIFANRFCCERLKSACDRKLAAFVASRQDAVDLMECAVEENAPILAASCLQKLLLELPESIKDEQVVGIFSKLGQHHRSIASFFSLYCFLSEVAMNADPNSDIAVVFLERLVESARGHRQKQLAFHQLGCARLSRKELGEAEQSFTAAVEAGHLYSVAGLARVAAARGDNQLAYERLSSAIASSCPPLGWMYQERSHYSAAAAGGDDDRRRLEDLDRATELDPTLVYPYMFRAADLMRRNQDGGAAIAEINRVLGFRVAVECLELRFCFYLAMEDYGGALRDVQAILSLSQGHRMLQGRVAAAHLRQLVQEHVEPWSAAECWMQLYDRCAAVDDVGSLSVIYQMLESGGAAKGVLYFRQSLLLLRLSGPEAAMRSLRLACRHAGSEHERLVYEGWILLNDGGEWEAGLRKAEESIALQRSFEGFFLKAYALACSTRRPSCYPTVISLLEDALSCPSDRLRKGQALNNLGSVYTDFGRLDLAADCFMSALQIRHTRAHQGLARVHFLKDDRDAAYNEMTKLIEKAKNNASAYEKRSEYCRHELTAADLQTATQLDPMRVYPYRYRAAVLMDGRKEKEAIAELTRVIVFKADLHLLHLRAAFNQHIGDITGALRDCRAALSVDPNHQEMLELRSRVNCEEP